jgi:hypothetical protein
MARGRRYGHHRAWRGAAATGTIAHGEGPPLRAPSRTASGPHDAHHRARPAGGRKLAAVTANIAFSLSAAVVSLAIVVLAGLKGDWAVAGVYAALIAGFLARASFGRHARPDPPEQAGPEPEDARRSGPEHEPERRLKPARFRRR